MRLIFIILSLVDFLLTAHLLDTFGCEAESNPCALIVYNMWGLNGLFLLKLASISLVVSIISYLLGKNHVVAARIVGCVGCSLTLGVVVIGICSLHS